MRTCTQTAGFSESLTSASWIAPLACSILPSRRKVAADMVQRSLMSLSSFVAWSVGDSSATGGSGEGGAGGDSMGAAAAL
jgi:hypothetical protein